MFCGGCVANWRDEGVRRIGLEVAVENDHALSLYTSLGFTQMTTEDYYALPLSRSSSSADGLGKAESG
jgi:ribosomal protein S18 acetylase RimI-like enzyme